MSSALQKLAHGASIALQDIPLVSRQVQRELSGNPESIPGPDLKHAREFNGNPYGKGYYQNPFDAHGAVVPRDGTPRYAQYMNADGSGGGFGPNNPSALQVQPQAQNPMPNLGVSFHQIQGRDNPGAIPLQNGGQGGPGYTANLQPQRRAYWQNLSGNPIDYVNPQVRNNGYYFDN